MAAKKPQPQSVSAGLGSVTGSSAGLGDDTARRKRRRTGTADKYAVGMCRDASDMLRIIISNDLVQLNKQMDIQQLYVNLVKSRRYHPQKVVEPKHGKEDLDEFERKFFRLIGYLRQIFPSDKDSFDPESDQVEQVRKHLHDIAVNVQRKEGQRSLFDEAMKPICSNSILTQQIAQKLLHALMHQLLMYQVDLDLSELIALATHLQVFNDNNGKPLKDHNDQDASVFLSRLGQTWKRTKKHETHHVEDSTEDVTAYNNFKSFLLICCKEIFDEEMMKQFADYKTEMEEDKIVEEQLGHLKRYADILIKSGALPEGVTLSQIMKAVIERGEAITPQILEEMYLRVALCMRINDAYKLEPETIRYSVLHSRWVGWGKGENYSQDAEDLHNDIIGMMAHTDKIKGASMPALYQALQDISKWVDRKVDVRRLSPYQHNALQVYERLVKIQTNLQSFNSESCIEKALNEVYKLLQNCCGKKEKDTANALKRNRYTNIKWSPFYDRVLDEFSACRKAFQKHRRDVPKVGYLLDLLTRLQVAVLDEVLVQLSDGLDYLCKNFWFSDDDVKNGIREEIDSLRLVANDRKHQLSIFCIAIANGKYLDSFSKLFDNFFTPTLAELCSTDQMIGERTKRGAYWWK